MSNVNLAIGGRTYTVACDAGQEAHIHALGRLIDGKIRGMGDSAGQGEARMLLFAALLLADELHEAKAALPRSAQLPLEAPMPPGLDARLEAIAERMENLAAHLEG